MERQTPLDGADQEQLGPALLQQEGLVIAWQRGEGGQVLCPPVVTNQISQCETSTNQNSPDRHEEQPRSSLINCLVAPH